MQAVVRWVAGLLNLVTVVWAGYGLIAMASKLTLLLMVITPIPMLLMNFTVVLYSFFLRNSSMRMFAIGGNALAVLAFIGMQSLNTFGGPRFSGEGTYTWLIGFAVINLVFLYLSKPPEGESSLATA